MRELGFQEQRRSSWRRAGSRRGGGGGGDTSPDSVIFTLESNLSLFSSASASVDRCSFASDAHDHDSLTSEISLVRTSYFPLHYISIFHHRLFFITMIIEVHIRKLKFEFLLFAAFGRER